jgi:hypothetical protein
VLTIGANGHGGRNRVQVYPKSRFFEQLAGRSLSWGFTRLDPASRWDPGSPAMVHEEHLGEVLVEDPHLCC